MIVEHLIVGVGNSCTSTAGARCCLLKIIVRYHGVRIVAVRRIVDTKPVPMKLIVRDLVHSSLESEYNLRPVLRC